MLVGYGRCSLIGRTLRNRTQTTSGTVSRLGWIRASVASIGSRRVIVILEIFSFFSFGSCLDDTWLGNKREWDLVIFIYGLAEKHQFLLNNITNSMVGKVQETSDTHQCKSVKPLQLPLSFFKRCVFSATRGAQRCKIIGQYLKICLFAETMGDNKKKTKTINTHWLIICWPFPCNSCCMLLKYTASRCENKESKSQLRHSSKKSNAMHEMEIMASMLLLASTRVNHLFELRSVI